MGLELARAFVKIKADQAELEPDLNKARQITDSYLVGLQTSITAAMGAISAAGSALLTKGLINAGAFEATTIAFETMIGSATETKKTLEDLTEFAAKTPFTMPEIESAARGLIQFGERGDELMETLNLLGNASAGTNTRFGDLALIFNQVRGVGKLLTQDFRQLSTRGVLSLQDIADYYGVATDAAQKMISEGKVSFEDLKAIFRELSAEGGRFANLMEKQSTSLPGLWSTLTDSLDLTTRAIGEGLLPEAKGFLETAISLTDTTRQWIGENSTLTASIIATTTGVTGLAAAYTGVSIAANLAGISMRGALVASGVGAALVGIGIAAGYVAEGLQDDAVAAANLKNEATALATQFDREATEEQKMIDRLKELRYQHDLTNEQMNEAERIIWKLEGQYGSFGLEVDRNTKQLVGNIDALKQLEDMRLKQRESVLQDALQEAIANQERLAEEMHTVVDEMHAFNQISQKMKQSGLQKEFDQWAARAKDLAKQIRSVKDQLGGKEPGETSTPSAPGLPGVPGLPEPDLLSDDEWFAKNVDPEVVRRQEEAFKGIAEAQRKMFEGERFRQSIMGPLDEAEQRFREIQQMMADPLYGVSEEDAAKALRRLQVELMPSEAESLLGAGRFGFADFGTQIQNALLQRNDPTEKVLQENQRQTALLGRVEGVLQRIEKKPSVATLG